MPPFRRWTRWTLPCGTHGCRLSKVIRLFKGSGRKGKKNPRRTNLSPDNSPRHSRQSTYKVHCPSPPNRTHKVCSDRWSTAVTWCRKERLTLNSDTGRSTTKFEAWTRCSYMRTYYYMCPCIYWITWWSTNWNTSSFLVHTVPTLLAIFFILNRWSKMMPTEYHRLSVICLNVKWECKKMQPLLSLL